MFHIVVMVGVTAGKIQRWPSEAGGLGVVGVFFLPSIQYEVVFKSDASHLPRNTPIVAMYRIEK